jgi:hypothetical protein
MTVTLAPAITLPDGSFTVPEMLPPTLAHSTMADRLPNTQTALTILAV